jgi:hypothetical protein
MKSSMKNISSSPNMFDPHYDLGQAMHMQGYVAQPVQMHNHMLNMDNHPSRNAMHMQGFAAQPVQMHNHMMNMGNHPSRNAMHMQGYVAQPVQMRNHMMDNQPRQKVLCRYDNNCNKEKCVFDHPNGKAVMSLQPKGPCRYGNSCKKEKCEFDHPNGKAVMSLQPKGPCRFDDGCKREKCEFDHPNGKAVMSLQPKGPCRFGDGCKKEKCEFDHPGKADVSLQKSGIDKVKREKGEEIFKLIAKIVPDRAGKITGIILDAGREDEALSSQEKLNLLVIESLKALIRAGK